MDNKTYDHFLIMKATIHDNRRASDDRINNFDYKLDKHYSKLDKIMSLINNMMH